MALESSFRPFFGTEKGVVWAADVDPNDFEPTMKQIGDVPGLVGVKLGFEVGYGLTIQRASAIVREYSPAKILFDHQKAGNDIPETSANFVRAMQRGRVDGAILFPFTGPETQTAWTRALLSEGLGVFSGAEMTHPGFKKAEGGSIPQTSLARIINLALELGVNDFIVPGNRARSVEKWRRHIERTRGIGKFALAAPGFVDQGGSITEAGAVAGEYMFPIMGRGIHANKLMKPRQAVEFYASQLNEAA